MKKGLWNKRIPSIFAFLVLFGSIWVTSILIQSGIIFVGRASPDKEPRNVSISNITDKSFTVSFTTNIPTVAGLSVDDGGVSFLVYDGRDVGGERKSFYSHYIVVPDLKPETTYTFSILSDGEEYLLNGSKYTVKTGSIITSGPLNQTPVSGKIILSSGGAGSDTIVKLTTPNSQVATALTKDDGTFIIPMNSLRTSGLGDYLIVDPTTELTLTAYRGQETSQIKVLYQNAANIPIMTLGEGYDFLSTTESEVSTAASQLKTSVPSGSSGTVSITTPREGQSFVDNRPSFAGVAAPNQTVKITINPGSLTTDLRTDGNGVWSYRSGTGFAPGSYSITLVGPDRFSISRSVSRNFTIFSSGSQVADSATPSATPTSTITPTPTLGDQTPTITITPIDEPTPTSSPTPTLTPTEIPVITTAPTTPPPITTPAPTGSNATLILTIVSTILIVTGGALLFLL